MVGVDAAVTLVWLAVSLVTYVLDSVPLLVSICSVVLRSGWVVVLAGNNVGDIVNRSFVVVFVSNTVIQTI